MPGMEYSYLFETSPRKLEPEYTPINRRKKVQNSRNKNINKNIKKSVKDKEKMSKSQENRKQIFNIIYVGITFLVLLLIAFRYSQITESFNRKEELKKQLSLIEKENEQLQVSIENSLNLNIIEQNAKELLGMQKLDSSQKKYVSLSKQDYVESAAEEVLIESQPQSLLEIIKNRLLGVK